MTEKDSSDETLNASTSSATRRQASPWDTPVKSCPYCEYPMEADWVDIEVGMQQCGPYHCDSCNASEIGPERGEKSDDELELDEDEKQTGFYKGRISPKANQVNGKPVSYRVADAIYRANYFASHGNPYNARIIR